MSPIVVVGKTFSIYRQVISPIVVVGRTFSVRGK